MLLLTRNRGEPDERIGALSVSEEVRSDENWKENLGESRASCSRRSAGPAGIDAIRPSHPCPDRLHRGREYRPCIADGGADSYAGQPNGDPANAQLITGASGTFSDSHLNISNVAITGVLARNFATPADVIDRRLATRRCTFPV